MFNSFLRKDPHNSNPLRLLAISILTGFLLFYSAISLADDTILYDANGNAVAYTSNDILYSWAGDPVAYISTDGAIYSYKGKNLGWYSDGVLYDANGYMLAFTPSSAPTDVKINTATKTVTITKETPTKTTVQTIIKKPVFVKKLSPTPFSTIYIYETQTP